MAEKMKLSGNVAAHTSSSTSNYGDCLSKILNLLTDFGKELKLGETVLKIHANTDAVDVTCSTPAHTYKCVEQHITYLQAVANDLKVLVEAEEKAVSVKVSITGEDRDASVPSVSAEERITEDSEPLPPVIHDRVQGSDESKSQPDDLTVQIRATKSEIERRISAFMERKQMEINENNVREFCNVIDCNQENSCARTDAVFTPYPGFKSHVKVTRVVNTYGPQTRGGGGQCEAGGQQRTQAPRDCGNPAVEERLQNIETHLKLPPAGPAPLSVYQRLKRLEDRILELEGLSPEYFQSTGYLHKRPKPSSSQACSLSELDGKINAVKAALLKRVNEFGPGFGTECPL